LGKPPPCAASDPIHTALAEVLSQEIASKLIEVGFVGGNSLHDFKIANVVIKLDTDMPVAIVQLDLSVLTQRR
jgi:hypothetical protein